MPQFLLFFIVREGQDALIGCASMKILLDKPRRGSELLPQAQGYVKRFTNVDQSKTDSVTKACDSVVHQA